MSLQNYADDMRCTLLSCPPSQYIYIQSHSLVHSVCSILRVKSGQSSPFTAFAFNPQCHDDAMVDVENNIVERVGEKATVVE